MTQEVGKQLTQASVWGGRGVERGGGGLSVQLGDTSPLNELSQVKQQNSQHNKLPGSWLPVCLRSAAAQ